jgi:leucyl/phenylalanyl-tRNA--protein transferase
MSIMPPHPDALDSVELLLDAYRAGWFPMVIRRPSDPAGPGAVGWCNPPERAVLPLDVRGVHGGEGVRISSNVRRRVRNGRFRITADRAFIDVIRACAAPRKGLSDTWIDRRIVDAYERLHTRGHCHSIEAWNAAGDLVGGLYGVHIGAAFIGESMFCRPELGGSDASKVCFAHLVLHLREQGFRLHDGQFDNPHLRNFERVLMPRPEYLELLRDAVAGTTAWGVWDPDAAVRLFATMVQQKEG